MKIRFFEDSIRLRLNQAEVEALGSGGALETVIPFTDEAFACMVQPTSGDFEAHHAAGRLTVMVPAERTKTWAESNEEGIYGEQPLAGGTRILRILVEKDYRCIHQPDSPANAGTFPNPASIGD